MKHRWVKSSIPIPGFELGWHCHWCPCLNGNKSQGTKGVSTTLAYNNMKEECIQHNERNSKLCIKCLWIEEEMLVNYALIGCKIDLNDQSWFPQWYKAVRELGMI